MVLFYFCFVQQSAELSWIQHFHLAAGSGEVRYWFDFGQTIQLEFNLSIYIQFAGHLS